MVNKKYISNEQAIPKIEGSDIFSAHPDARFAIGAVSHSSIPTPAMKSLFTAYLQLRANVYIDQTHMLGQEHKRNDGTEIDDNDKRAVHFVAVENRRSHVAAVASLRVIEKTEASASPLPVEEFFAEEFADDVVPVGGVEISRYIQRHTEKLSASHIRSGLFLSALALIHNKTLRPTLAVVEEDLEQSLKRGGIPIERIAAPRWVEEYKSTNIGIKIDTDAFAEQLGGNDILRAVDTEPGKLTFWGELHTSHGE